MERSFTRSVAALCDVFSYVDEFTASIGLDMATSYPLRLAIEEVFVNMVEHNPTGSGDIAISLGGASGSLVATLRDPDTAAYDITKHQFTARDAPLKERTPGGLGIHLINHLMDEVTYAHHDREASIRLVKHFRDEHANDRHE